MSMNKAHQRADWARRPLPGRMLAYAAADTRHLIPLAELLEGELERLGRLAWAEEEFRSLLKTAVFPKPTFQIESPQQATRLDQLNLSVGAAVQAALASSKLGQLVAAIT